MKKKTILQMALLLAVFMLLPLATPKKTTLSHIFGEQRGLTGQEKNPEKRWYPGFDKEVTGETILYHSPQPDAKEALLVRSLDENRFIEWETEPMLLDPGEDSITFVWIAGIDVTTDSHTFHLFINGERWFTFSNPRDHSKRLWNIRGPRGVRLEYKVTMIDKYDDFMGYMFLTVPRPLFPAGKPLRIRILGESANSRTWYMTFKHRVEPKVWLFSEQAMLREARHPRQSIRAEIVHLGEPVQASLSTKGQTVTTGLELGFNSVQIAVPAVEEPEDLAVAIAIGDEPQQTENIRLRPVQKKDIYILHHSHVDIGYTHVQSEVEKIQRDNLEKAIAYAEASEDFPEGSRFKWNTEVMWPVDGYLRSSAEEKKNRLTKAVRAGWIGLDALYANALTGLCRPEELLELLRFAREAARNFQVPVDAAMITDIPGYTWGLVPALALSGIKYLSIGPNSGHRIGYVLEEWADRPFYWVSPSGQEKVLCWVHGKGYSWFHTGLGYEKLRSRLQEKPIFEYLSELEATGYPYDIVCFRYNIGSDNGPPDPLLAQTVRDWNEKYLSPRMVIATTSEVFRTFEDRYGNSLPVLRGDFTGHWEDGAASSARETALNREAAERLVQAQVMWTLLNPKFYPEEKFTEAWRQVLLYDEHTWGSWNSISEPDSEFTRQQWDVKQAFALTANRLSRELLEAAFQQSGARDTLPQADLGFEPQAENPGTKIEPVNTATPPDVVVSIDVYNMNSWPRTDLIVLQADKAGGTTRVDDEQGRPVASQRLSTGELAVFVEDVPPLGGKRLFLKTLPASPAALVEMRTQGRLHAHQQAPATAQGTILENGLVRLKIDETTGAIASLKAEGIDEDLVDGSKGLGLNDYFYVLGRKPDHPQMNSKVFTRVKEPGSLVASLLIQSEAPGCRSLEREVRLIAGIDRVDISTRIDKTAEYSPEGVHLAFPFHVPEGKMHVDVAWGVYQPEDEQLPGSCKNYFTVQRWVDISNQEYGLSWVTIDAPMVEIGEITTDPIVVGWKKQVAPSQTLYSYVMNNYWETNYKAAQEGWTEFRYSVRPHRQYSSGEAERFSIEHSQPLIVAQASSAGPPPPSFFQVKPIDVVVTSLKPSRNGKAILIRLYNAKGKPERVSITWGNRRPRRLFFSDLWEMKGAEVQPPFEMPGFGIVTLRAEDFN